MKNKIPSLEFIRGVACLTVLLSHVRVATTYYTAHTYDVMQVMTSWGNEAVTVFFILSGIVINISTQKKISRIDYFKKRFFRIYPIYFLSISLCLLISYLILGRIADLRILLGNLFILGTSEGHLVQTIPFNVAVWSISCEVFFYVVYGLIYKRNRLTNMWCWLAISIFSILIKMFSNIRTDISILNYLIYMLNMSFIWIVGYLLYEYRRYANVSLQTAVLGLMMVPLATRMHLGHENIIQFKFHLAAIYLIPSFLYLLKDYSSPANHKVFEVKSYYLWTLYLANLMVFWSASGSTYFNRFLYPILPLSSLIFYSNIGRMALVWIYQKLSEFFLQIANISYAVYLIHIPIMYLIAYLIPHSPTWGMISIMLLIFSLGFVLENLFQNKAVRYFRKFPISKRLKKNQDSLFLPR